MLPKNGIECMVETLEIELIDKISTFMSPVSLLSTYLLFIPQLPHNKILKRFIFVYT